MSASDGQGFTLNGMPVDTREQQGKYEGPYEGVSDRDGSLGRGGRDDEFNYSYSGNRDYSYPDDSEGEEGREKEEEEAMPAEYYRSVDSFLTRAPPKLKKCTLHIPLITYSDCQADTWACVLCPLIFCNTHSLIEGALPKAKRGAIHTA